MLVLRGRDLAGPKSSETAISESNPPSDSFLVSNLSTREFQAMRFNGWLSPVPRLAPPVTTLPPSTQKLAAPKPPSEIAFTLFKPVPFPEKLFAALLNVTDRKSVV